jgi:hypothetical protein
VKCVLYVQHTCSDMTSPTHPTFPLSSNVSPSLLPNNPDMSPPPLSSDHDTSSMTTSTNTNNGRKKRKCTSKPRSNRSHTFSFFYEDEKDAQIVYCKICSENLPENQKPYPYSRKGGNTSNLINHLRDKHDITKDNYLEFLDDNSEVYGSFLRLGNWQ